MYTHNDHIAVDAGFDGLDYNYASAQPAGNNSHGRGERALWCAVIEQAFMDLDLAVVRHEALRWLTRDKNDFKEVCLLAGVSPAVIRRAALIRASQIDFSHH